MKSFNLYTIYIKKNSIIYMAVLNARYGTTLSVINDIYIEGTIIRVTKFRRCMNSDFTQ